MKSTFLCLFVDDGEPGGIAVLVPDIPGCASSADDLPHAREIAKEIIEFCIEGAVEDGEPVFEPKMSTFAETVEWFRELMNYELDGETEEDRAFNEDDLHVEMIEVEVKLPTPAPR